MAVRITTLFLDIGGVLLTNGWDRRSRRQAAEKYGIIHEGYEATRAALADYGLMDSEGDQ